MPKPLIRRAKTETKNDTILNPRRQNVQEMSQNEKMRLDRMLRKTRSKEYMDAIAKLDAGGHVHNKQQLDNIINTIQNEFPELTLYGSLIGYVSKCYLGDPYEVHVLDLGLQIVEHYKKGETLPDGLEKARSIAVNGGYEFIEVFTDCCRAVGADGRVSVFYL